MVTALESTPPTVDEFRAPAAPPYAITARVGALSETFEVNVDMGPSLVSASQQLSALITQPLAEPVRKIVKRYQRRDTRIIVNGQDDDNGDFRDEDVDSVERVPVSGVTVAFDVRREDGRDEASVGLAPTRTWSASAVTDDEGMVSVGVDMGDVGGVQHVVGTTDAIEVVWGRRRRHGRGPDHVLDAVTAADVGRWPRPAAPS